MNTKNSAAKITILSLFVLIMCISISALLSCNHSSKADTAKKDDAPPCFAEAVDEGVNIICNGVPVLLPKAKDGKDGRNGLNGSQGPAGTPGTGTTPGPKGDKGEKGDTGLQGTSGKDGTRGQDGSAGPQGEKGLPGEPGRAGPSGLPGRDGVDGANGKDGLNGRAVIHNDACIFNISTTSQRRTIYYNVFDFSDGFSEVAAQLTLDNGSETFTNMMVYKAGSGEITALPIDVGGFEIRLEPPNIASIKERSTNTIQHYLCNRSLQ